MSNIVFVSPTGSWLPRHDDGYGNGMYGSPRSRVEDGRVVRYTHPGIDLFVEPDRPIVSPVVGEIFRHIRCYGKGPGAEHYTGLSVNATWCRVEILYVGFNKDDVPVGKAVDAGERIGIAQDLRTRYPGKQGGEPITPHIHLEFVRIDPAAVWAATGVFKQAEALAKTLRDI